MSTRPRVFIGSSSEGLTLATAVRILLIGELGDTATIEPWTRKFELSDTYIESLEKIAAEADFAVLVLTPDDVTTSRDMKKLAPRDNVIFELGLFMGALGRDRCYLVHENDPRSKTTLKLPSDLLGVKAATFRAPENGDIEAAVSGGCALIARKINTLGVRHKLTPDELTAQASELAFCDRIVGAWWEYVEVAGKRWLSFFKIEPNTLHSTVELKEG